MGLTVTRLNLRDFRSYEEFDVEPDGKLTILVGPNAAGKTNIIEALQLVTSGDSFRRPQWSELVRWGCREAAVSLKAQGENRCLETVLSVGAAGRRVYRVNGKVRRRISEVAGIIPCVVFTPDDLRMVKDSADKRRAAIDGVGDQLSPAYLTVRMEYERIIRQRNSLLKDPQRNDEVLEALTERLVIKGVAFMGHRHRLFDRVAARVSEVYETLAPGESLSATYVPSWQRGAQPGESGEPTELMWAALRERAAEEKARGVTLVGPHRDEVTFAVNGHEARAFRLSGSDSDYRACLEAGGGGRHNGHRRAGASVAAR